MTESVLEDNRTNKKYNYCLDFIKGLACVFVVFMHCEFPGTFGTIVQAISRFCVPFFFMVSGYFCFNPERELSRADYQRKIIHIGRIVLYSSLFYLAWHLFQLFFLDGEHVTLSPASIAAFLLFNLPVGISNHLWFLFALLYVYVFYSILVQLRFNRLSYLLAACLFILYFLLAHVAYFFGFDVPNCVYRNWLVEGFPFFMAGKWIHEHEKSLIISNEVLLLIIIVSSLLCLLERYFVGRDFGVNLFTIPQVFAMFVYATRNPLKNSGFIQRIGKVCSLHVYVLHIFIWQLLRMIYQALGIETNIVAGYAMPVLVVVVTIVMSLALTRLPKLKRAHPKSF